MNNQGTKGNSKWEKLKLSIRTEKSPREPILRRLVDGWLYISGQGPLNLVTGEIVQGTMEEQTKLTLEHIGKILSRSRGDFRECSQMHLPPV